MKILYHIFSIIEKFIVFLFYGKSVGDEIPCNLILTRYGITGLLVPIEGNDMWIRVTPFGMFTDKFPRGYKIKSLSIKIRLSHESNLIASYTCIGSTNCELCGLSIQFGYNESVNNDAIISVIKWNEKRITIVYCFCSINCSKIWLAISERDGYSKQLNEISSLQ